ncbi:hypothetical protein KP509_10G058700 [Ceratopteris richardii]|uniref:Uncharacterized protein n=1 Tax=Ceratopteris richardii TaxID=49495 RepID=A0A8T2TVN8_CERRI|nr:hypothetical protein KP509_10G058700 [Ceratopteris richardii]
MEICFCDLVVYSCHDLCDLFTLRISGPYQNSHQELPERNYSLYSTSGYARPKSGKKLSFPPHTPSKTPVPTTHSHTITPNTTPPIASIVTPIPSQTSLPAPSPYVFLCFVLDLQLQHPTTSTIPSHTLISTTTTTPPTSDPTHYVCESVPRPPSPLIPSPNYLPPHLPFSAPIPNHPVTPTPSLIASATVPSTLITYNPPANIPSPTNPCTQYTFHTSFFHTF